MTANDTQRDIAVQPDERGIHTEERWLTVEPNNRIREWESEDRACQYQREWRRAHRLHPMTGEAEH